MIILFKRVYKFDLNTNQPVEIIIDPKAEDFNLYLEELILDVIQDDRSKKYNFPDYESFVQGAIAKVLKDPDNIAAGTAGLDAAKKLLKIEVDVQNRIDHLSKEVQKGIMVQALVEENNKKYFLIIKAEHHDFINEKDNRRATGLPIKKKIFKAFCASIDKKDKLLHAAVSDYRNVISTYWWKDFLELEEVHSNEYNTETAFDALDRKIFNSIRDNHPQDYMYLRNATVQYFRSNDEFVMADYVKKIIKPYKPEDRDLDIPTISGKIEALPEKSNFDQRFEIIKDRLRKKIITKLQLTPQLDLVIKENINLRTSITAIQEKGIKFIKIRTDEGYEYFNKQ